MIRVEVRGDSLIDLADEVTDETRPKARKAMREALNLFAAEIRRLLAIRTGEVSREGQPPAQQTGDLLRGVRVASVRVRGNTVMGAVEVGKHEDIEKVQGLEFGATGDDGRVLKPRPFMRPAEENVQTAVDKVLTEGVQ